VGQDNNLPETVEGFFEQYMNEPEESVVEEEAAEEQAVVEEVEPQQSEIEELKNQLAALQQQNAQLTQMVLKQAEEKKELTVPEIPDDIVSRILEAMPEEKRQELEELALEDPIKAQAKTFLYVDTVYRQIQAEEARRREEELMQQQEAYKKEAYYAAKELQELYGVNDQDLNEIAEIILKERQDLITLHPRQALRDAYEVWKQRKGVNEVQSAVMQAFKNPQVLAEVLKDPQVLNAVAQALKPEIIKSTVETNSTVPILIANQPGGAPVASAPTKPKSAREAGKLWAMQQGLQ